ncbi:hypothetical protein MKX03_024908 [Papaver bracteatum]|nr:hypothetical protein MKX03_024908 [Papaver bracteatum]
MDPQQSQIVNNPNRRTGGLPERRIPLTPYRFGFRYPSDPSFLSSFVSPPLPHPPTYTDPFIKGCVVLDSLPPENEESYAKGWYSGFTEESHAADAESSQVSDVEAIRDKATGQSGSYGSIESNSHAAADEHRDDSHEFSVFVANLAADVTDYVLEETFKVKYTSVKGARVVTDRTTGRSKGYGFVRFADKEEQMRSLTELNGQYCLTKPMRVAPGPASMPKGTFLISYCGFRDCAVEAMGTLNGTQLGGSNIRLAWAPSLSNEQDPFGGMVQQHADLNQRPDAAGNMLYEYNGSYEAYGYVVTNKISFQDGRPVCYQQFQKQA